MLIAFLTEQLALTWGLQKLKYSYLAVVRCNTNSPGFPLLQAYFFCLDSWICTLASLTYTHVAACFNS